MVLASLLIFILRKAAEIRETSWTKQPQLSEDIRPLRCVVVSYYLLPRSQKLSDKMFCTPVLEIRSNKRMR